MSILFSKDMFPKVRIDMQNIPVMSVFEVTSEYAFNPVKIVKKIYGNHTAYAGLLWTFNNITDPFTQLTAGRILRIPTETSANNAVRPSNTTRPTTKVKQAKVSGTKIVY